MKFVQGNHQRIVEGERIMGPKENRVSGYSFDLLPPRNEEEIRLLLLKKPTAVMLIHSATDASIEQSKYWLETNIGDKNYYTPSAVGRLIKAYFKAKQAQTKED